MQAVKNSDVIEEQRDLGVEWSTTSCIDRRVIVYDHKDQTVISWG